MVTLRPMLLKCNTIRQDRRQIGIPKLIHFLVPIVKHEKVIIKFTNLEILYIMLHNIELFSPTTLRPYDNPAQVQK
jgi:hypothetical protein